MPRSCNPAPPTEQTKKQAKALEEELKTGIFNPLLGDPAETHPYASDYSDDSLYGDAEVGLPSARRRPGGKVPEDPEEPGCFGEGGCCGCLCCCFRCNRKKPMTPLELREENDRRRTLGMPLLDEEETMTRKEAKKKRKEVRAGNIFWILLFGGGRGWADGRVTPRDFAFFFFFCLRWC